MPAATRLVAADVHGLLRVRDGVALAFRHDDVRTLAADPRVGNTPAETLTARRRAGDPSTVGFGPVLVNQMFVYNPPLHTEIRRIVTRQLTPGTIGRFAPVAQAVVDELVDELASRDRFDAVTEFAERVATRFWGRLFGLAPDEIVAIQHCNTVLSTIFLAEMTPAQFTALEATTAEYLRIITTAVAEAIDGTRRCVEPGLELLRDMAADLEHVASPGGPRDIGHLVAGNFFDGFHTVGVGLASAIALLLADRPSHERVVADPSLAMAAYDEGTRLAAPLILTYRTLLDDVDHHGVHLPVGTMIGMHWGAANIDPAAFADPHRYDLDRRQRGLLTFGAGPHLCPGRNAARLVGEIALRTLITRLPGLHLDGDPVWIARSSSAQLERCPVRSRA
jgi:cytochrome P450